MVKYNSESVTALDSVFSALSDATRRAILARLIEGEATVTQLAQPFGISLPAVSKHLRALEQAGLLQRRKQGREQHCSLRAQPLMQVAAWIAHYRSFWGGQLDALEQFLDQTQQQEEGVWQAQTRKSKQHSTSHDSSKRRGKKSSRPGPKRKP